ncbi:translation machinery-associated protein 16-like [Amphibalanus amphitrite]|uniref:translation machinery-associated protein 16-like n=1 Tax=Amphibalanus amphitrite TaxID=1232801 RepID=UPI001C92900B|nr:translation machinery-associated protein 16-like [Amphibalanus amphitrite]
MGKLEKKKEPKLVHPNSRKAAAIVKKKIKTARREQKKERGHQHLRLLSERLVWFRDNLPAEKQRFTVEQTHQLIEQYIARHTAELEQLRGRAAPRGPAGRRAKPPQRLAALEATLRAETDEFTQGGIEVADLTNEEAVLYLRAWDGQVKLVPQIKTRRFIRGRLAEPAANTASETGQQMAEEAVSGESETEEMKDDS